MIELTGVRKVYNQGRGNEFQALNGIELSIEERQVMGLVWPQRIGQNDVADHCGCLAKPTTGR